MSILRKYPFGLDLALWVHVRINIRVYKCKFGLAPKLQHSLITNSIKKALKERQKNTVLQVLWKKNLYFLFPQRVKLLHKSQIPIVMNEIRMLKKSRWYESCNTWIKLRKNKTKNLWIREITVVMLLPVQSNLWL